MSEIVNDNPLDRCANCPRRGPVSRLLALASGVDRLAPDCEGPVSVSRGEIKTWVSRSVPRKSEFSWNIMIGSSDGYRRYVKTDWSTEQVCGREPVEPRHGEVPYFRSGAVWTNGEDGSRYAAFISGNEEQLGDVRGVQAAARLLDSAEDMQAAAEQGDAEAVGRVENRMGAAGFRLLAVSGRGSEALRDYAITPEPSDDDESD